MSLINQVLKDLERRHAGRDLRGLSDTLRALPEDRPRRAMLWAIGGVLALSGVSAAAAWWFLSRAGAPAAPPASPLATPVPAPAQPAAAAPSPLAAVPLAQSGTVGLAPAPAPIPAETAVTSPPVALPSVALPSGQLRQAQDAAGPARPVPVASRPPGLTPAPRASAALPDGSDSPAQKPARATRLPAPPAQAPSLADASPTAEPATTIDKQQRPLEPHALADGEFRRGMKLLQAAHSTEAENAFRAALAADPAMEPARQALLGLLLESGRRDEAEKLLREGLAVNPRNSKFAMILARMQLDRGTQEEAIATLSSNLPNAQWDPEYLAMAGAVFARAGRHRDAADMYQAALRMVPNNALWCMGLGLALKADGRTREAAAVFQQARDIGTLSPDLRAFVDQQLADLR